MQLLAPLMLIGLIGLVLPIAIHMLNRSQSTVIDWPTLRFLQLAQRKSAQGARLKNLLVLLARCLLLALIVLAMAQPYTQDSDWHPPPELPTTLVIAIDRSYSMGYRDVGSDRTRFERARQLALEHLSELTIDDEVALVLFDERAQTMTTRPTRDHNHVAQMIKDATLSMRGTDARPALAAAFALAQLDAEVVPMDGADPSLHTLKRDAWREVLLLSDMQRAGWEAVATDDFITQIDEAAPVTIIDLGNYEAGNRYIRDVEINRSALGESIEIEVDIAFDGPQSTGAGQMRLWMNDQRAGNPVVVPPTSGRVTLTTDVPGPGVHQCVIEVDEDRLSVDDRAYFAINVTGAQRLILVDGSPSQVAALSETYYLEHALETGTARGGNFAIQRLGVSDLGRASLGTGGCLVLANVGHLDGAALAAIERFLRGGGNVWIALGDSANPTHLNQDWPFLPLKLDRMLGDPMRSRAYAVLVDEPDHPVFAGSLDLSATRLFAFIGSDPTTLKPAGRILASLSNGSPYLIEGTFGRDHSAGGGRILLMTSSIDTDWSNLPYRRAFLPMVDRIVTFLTRQQLDARSITLGDPVRFTAPASLAGRAIQVTTPDGTTQTIHAALDTDAQQAVAVYDQADRVGHYRVQADPGFSAVGAFAVNIDPRESRLGPVSADQVAEAFGDVPVRILQSRPADLSRWGSDQSREPTEQQAAWWPWLIMLACAIFVIETCLANTFTRRATPEAPPTIEYQGRASRTHAA